MKVNYCPQCGEDVTSHYKTHAVFASYNEFYCKRCFHAFTVDESEIPDAALEAMNYCQECGKFDGCQCEPESNNHGTVTTK